MNAVFKREFKAYFSTPIGFIILAIFYFFLGMYFCINYSYGSPDSSTIIIAMSTICLFTVPVITMRLMSEDRRQKVDQALLTAPVKLSAIVLGKYFAALALYALCFVPTIIFQIIIATYVPINIFTYLYSLLGMLLFGSALISIGMFLSSLTESPVISAILTYVVNLTVMYLGGVSSMIQNEKLAAVAKKVAFISAVESFGEEVLSIPDVVFFLSITVAFVFLSVRSLEKRRWS